MYNPDICVVHLFLCIVKFVVKNNYKKWKMDQKIAPCSQLSMLCNKKKSLHPTRSLNNLYTPYVSGGDAGMLLPNPRYKWGNNSYCLDIRERSCSSGRQDSAPGVHMLPLDALHFLVLKVSRVLCASGVASAGPSRATGFSTLCFSWCRSLYFGYHTGAYT